VHRPADIVAPGEEFEEHAAQGAARPEWSAHRRRHTRLLILDDDGRLYLHRYFDYAGAVWRSA
jgi:hypothetical protein